MGMGVVNRLLSRGFSTHVRDIRPEAELEAGRLGARCHSSSGALIDDADVAIVLVVDAGQIDDVLFGPGGALPALRPGKALVVASTVDPDYVAGLTQRIRATGAALVDAPVSGGPRRAADGSMTIMASGDAAALSACTPVFDAIAGRVFHVGATPGDAAKFKIVNNLLAAANLAAGAEALALAAKAGLDPRLVVDVINASSGSSWILADRMSRALADDYAPRAAARILAKDAGLATQFARRHGVEATFASAALAAFKAAVDDGLGEEDDAVLYRHARRRAGLPD